MLRERRMGMEKDVKLREFCLELAMRIAEKVSVPTSQEVIEAARKLEKYILSG